MGVRKGDSYFLKDCSFPFFELPFVLLSYDKTKLSRCYCEKVKPERGQ